MSQPAKSDPAYHGSPEDRGSSDAYYGRPKDPHKYPNGTYNPPRIALTDPEEVAAYNRGYDKLVVSQARLVHRLPWDTKVWRRIQRAITVANPYTLYADTHYAVNTQRREEITAALCKVWKLKRCAKRYESCA